MSRTHDCPETVIKELGGSIPQDMCSGVAPLLQHPPGLELGHGPVPGPHPSDHHHALNPTDAPGPTNSRSACRGRLADGP